MATVGSLAAIMLPGVGDSNAPAPSTKRRLVTSVKWSANGINHGQFSTTFGWELMGTLNIQRRTKTT